MTRIEALKRLDRFVRIQTEGYYTNLANGGVEDPDFEDDIEAIEIAVAAIGKQIPDKPVLMSDGSLNGYRQYRCPKCGARVHLQSYCMHCGQAIKGGSGMEADSIIIDEVAHDTQKED